MQIARYDIIIKRGETYCQDAVFRDKVTKEPLDLTGLKASAEVRPSEESDTLIGVIYCDVFPEDGYMQLSMPKNKTAEIEPGFYTWDMKMKDEETGNIAYEIEGNFIVKGRTTK
jgi:hypothetical protein